MHAGQVPISIVMVWCRLLFYISFDTFICIITCICTKDCKIHVPSRKQQQQQQPKTLRKFSWSSSFWCLARNLFNFRGYRLVKQKYALMCNVHFPGKIFLMKSSHYKTICWQYSLSFPVVCFKWKHSLWGFFQGQ